MNNEYIIVNKTSLEKKIEEWELELQECFKASIGEFNSDYVSTLQQALSITRELISISTPLIPDIEKAYITGESSRYSHIGQEVCNYCGKTLREQMKGCKEITCYRQYLRKQETTIEKTAKELYPINNTGSMFMATRDELNNSYKQEAFIEGAKWMEQRMYSDEQVIELIQFLSMDKDFNGYGSVSKETAKYFLEKFKKQ